MTGWFPRYDPVTGALITEGVGRTQCQWIATGVSIWNQFDHLWINGVPTDILGLNELTAGGGRWAGTRGAPDVQCSWRPPILGAGFAALDPAGVLAYKADRQSNDSPLILEGVGQVDRGPIADVRMSIGLLVYTKGTGQSVGYDRRARRLVDLGIPGVATFRPVPVDTPGGPWILNHTDTGIVLRPLADPLNGYRFDNGGNTYYPDAVFSGEAIRVAFTDSRGELEEKLFTLTAPRVDLRLPVQPPVPPVDPPIDPEVPVDYPFPEGYDPLPALKSVRARFPTPLGAQYGDFLVQCCKAVGFKAGLMHKDGGTFIVLANGAKVSQDWMVFPNRAGLDFLLNGENTADVSWGPARETNPGQYLDVSSLFDAPEQPPTADLKALQQAVALLTGRVRQLEDATPPQAGTVDEWARKKLGEHDTALEQCVRTTDSTVAHKGDPVSVKVPYLGSVKGSIDK